MPFNAKDEEEHLVELEGKVNVPERVQTCEGVMFSLAGSKI